MAIAIVLQNFFLAEQTENNLLMHTKANLTVYNYDKVNS